MHEDNGNGITPAVWKVFLKHLREHRNVRKAAELTGVRPRALRRYREKHPKRKQTWDDIMGPTGRIRTRSHCSKKEIGRPPKYDPLYHPEKAYQLITRLGARLEDLADVFDISLKTLHEWRDVYQAFGDSIETATDDLSAGKIKMALGARAMGFSVPEDKIFCHVIHEQVDGETVSRVEVTRVPTEKYYPPEVSAITYFLNNWSRRRGNNEFMQISRHEHTGKGGGPLENVHLHLSLSEMLLQVKDLEVLRSFQGLLKNLVQVSLPAPESPESDDDPEDIEVCLH